MDNPTDNLGEGPLPPPNVVVVRARRDGRELASRTLSTLGVTELTVGSDTGCELCLPHSGVSRRHLTLSLTPRGVRAKDLGSTNGTLFQGSKLSDALIPIGAALLLGKIEVRLEELTRGSLAQLGTLTTSSPLMASVLGVLGRAAKTDVTVLIE